jgi:hypothetical protein
MSYEVGPDIKNYEADDDTDGAVLIPLIQGHDQNAYRYCILAHAFRCRGYEPIVLLCDGALDACFRKAYWDHPAVCDLCESCGDGMVSEFGLDAHYISELVDDDLPQLAVDAVPGAAKFHDVPIGRFALASARKFLKKHHIDVGKGQEAVVYRRFLETARRLVLATEELLDRHEIVAAVGHNPKYVYAGVPLSVANREGVTSATHMRGYGDGVVMFGSFSNRSSFPNYTDPALLETVLNTPLTDRESEAIEELMQRRFTGTEARLDYTSMASGETVDAQATCLVGMFTNLIWDASLAVEEAPYPDVFDWIDDTIRILSNRDDVHLLIKLHPSEKLLGTRESVGDWIDQNHRPLADNVSVLPPDTGVDTYQLLDDLSAAIVYNSTVGLEMAYKGGPVVVGGDTHYRLLGFTHDVTDQAEYCDVVSSVSELDTTSEMQRRARRYAHFLFLRKQLTYPFYETSDKGTRLLPVSHDQIAPGTEPFDNIVKRVISGDPVYAEPQYDTQPSADT